MAEPSLHETLLRSRLTLAAIEALQKAWPDPIDLSPSQLGETGDERTHVAFVEIVYGLVDEGLIMTEALLIGATDEPLARQAVLTRKGATILFYVTRPP